MPAAEGRRQDSGPPARSYCCCWCCSRVLLLLWFGRTHAHKPCAFDLWVEGVHAYRATAGCAGPDLYPVTPTERRVRETQLLISTYRYTGIHRHTGKVLGSPLQRRLSERPSCKSDLSLSHAPPLGMSRVSVSGAIIAAATPNHRRLSQQNPAELGFQLVELGRISRHFVELKKKCFFFSPSGIDGVPIRIDD